MTDKNPDFRHLRDCPFCKAKPSDDCDSGPALFEVNAVAKSGTYNAYYIARCISCGASIEDEYLSGVTESWNGTPIH